MFLAAQAPGEQPEKEKPPPTAERFWPVLGRERPLTQLAPSCCLHYSPQASAWASPQAPATVE